jgi:hypothetical protein
LHFSPLSMQNLFLIDLFLFSAFIDVSLTFTFALFYMVAGQVFRQSIRSVASMPTLRTPVAKARGWIREALNLRVLDEFLLFILHESRLVELFYTPESILRKPDNIVVLMAVLRTLKVLPFFVTVEDNSLNFTPSWVLAMIATATAGNIARPIAPSSGSESLAMAGNAPLSLSRLKVQPKGIFSSFMSSMERGISGVLESVDSLASRVEKETSFGKILLFNRYYKLHTSLSITLSYNSHCHKKMPQITLTR